LRIFWSAASISASDGDSGAPAARPEGLVLGRALMAGKWSAGASPEEVAAVEALEGASRPPRNSPAPNPAKVSSAIRITLLALMRALSRSDQWH